MQGSRPNTTQFLYEEHGAVAQITFNRPDTLNSLTFDVYGELRDTFEALNRNDKIRAVVITGQGRGFCSEETLR